MGRWGLSVLALCIAGSAMAGETIDVALQGERSIVFRFPEPMQTLSTQAATPMARFVPALRVSACNWSDDTTFACTLPDPPPIATRFVATLPAGLRTVLGAPLPKQALTFESARPQLYVDRSWDRDTGQLKITIGAPKTASAAAIAAALRMTVDGKSVPVVVRSHKTSYGNNWTVDLPEVSQESTLVLAVVPGLAIPDGPLRGIQDAVVVRATIGETFQVRGAACAGGNDVLIAPVRDGRIDLDGCVPGEQVRVLLSRPADDKAWAAWRDAWPAGVRAFGDRQLDGPMRYNDKKDMPPERAPGASTLFTIDAAHARQIVQIPALPSQTDGARLAPVELHVSTSGPRPSFVAPFKQALLIDGTDPGLRSVNAPEVTLNSFALGRDAERASTKSPPSTEAGNAVALPDVRRALADSGYAHIAPQRIGGGDAQRDGIAIAAPDFDVYASTGTRSVVAWANTWDDGAPVADARAELLFDDGTDAMPRVVATSRTDAQGVAVLRLADDFRLPERDSKQRDFSWYLRVERGGSRNAQRAVLPIDAYRWRSMLGSMPDARLWGVADRPLYRAGDTVHWTVWARENMGGHDRAPAPSTHTLQLKQSSESRTVSTWETQFDAAGRASGTTRIPEHARDGDYCIGTKSDNAVCFHVGVFRPQDLWARASTQQSLVRPGDTLSLAFDTGFYSGGSGAGIGISKVSASVRAMSPAAAFPQWAAYRFARSEIGEAGVEDLDALQAQTDAKGHSTLALPLDERFDDIDVPYGVLRVAAEARPQDRESTTSNDVVVRFSTFEHHVGLKVEGAEYAATGPVTLTAVVIDNLGQEVPGQQVDVDVTYNEFDTEQSSPVHHCVLVSGKATDCTFPRVRSGVYVLHARSKQASPARVERLVWAHDGTDDAQDANVEIALVDPEGENVAGAPIHVQVSTPVYPTRALLAVYHDADVLWQRVVTLDGPLQLIEVPTRADMPMSIDVSIAVRRTDAKPTTPLPAGYRRPVPVDRAEADVTLAAPNVAPAITLAFERAQAAPADTARLVLRNEGNTARHVTLAIVDDALRALGEKWLKAMDPRVNGLRTQREWDSPVETSFGDWNQAALRWVIARDFDSTCHYLDECIITVMGSGAINPIDVASVESTTILTAEQISRIPVSRDTTSVALLAPGTVQANNAGVFGFSGSLDSVSVVGSPAPPPQAQNDGKSPTGAPRPDRSAPADYGATLARIRTDFADTALWRDDIVLAPGESQTIELVVPDNLTRWRAVAWSDDGADAFEMGDATLEAGLPVEARLQTPVRVYAGDTARLALNVRQVAEHASEAEAHLQIVDGDATQDHPTTLSLPAAGQASFGATIAPKQAGMLRAIGAAATADGRDAVAAPIEVASTTILGTKTQAGWVGDAPMTLDLPALPAGAHDAHVDVSVWRGPSALVTGWSEMMQRYPHRCWEQILSRAVAAALAIERGDTSWPDAKAVVREALDNAAVFQGGDGSFRYFNGSLYGGYEGDAVNRVPLTVYSVDALALLRSLGYAVSPGIEENATRFLANANWDNASRTHIDDVRALAAGVVDLASEPQAKFLATDTGTLMLPARIASARALARGNAPGAQAAIDALLALAPARGGVRELDRGVGLERWMSSNTREQCALIRLLDDYPQYAPAGARRALVAGLADLYAGGAASIDTQAAAACLRALRPDALTGKNDRLVVDATLAARTARIDVAPGEDRAAQAFALDGADALTLSPVERSQSPVAWLARVEYQEDARKAQSSAMGFAITRGYEVKRNGAWVPLGGSSLRDGDWVRITLTVDSTAERWFVAVTDDLPGGLLPIDLDLTGVAGPGGHDDDDRRRGPFEERKLDPRKPKFYAPRLPAGHHVIRYVARVGNTGDYLAAPAVAELMYGQASRARTAADRIRIQSPGKP